MSKLLPKVYFRKTLCFKAGAASSRVRRPEMCSAFMQFPSQPGRLLPNVHHWGIWLNKLDFIFFSTNSGYLTMTHMWELWVKYQHTFPNCYKAFRQQYRFSTWSSALAVHILHWLFLVKHVKNAERKKGQQNKMPALNRDQEVKQYVFVDMRDISWGLGYLETFKYELPIPPCWTCNKKSMVSVLCSSDLKLC